ncbi:YwaF family protein [Kibdelosporangium aridum]|uniref:YwaF family protein n=1 Tax=Kibdelosporangium aridum TaxID=2030 RepID=UPI000523F7BD
MSAGREFTAYGASHWVVLVLFALGSVALVVVGRRWGGTVTVRRVAQGLAAAVLLVHVAAQVYLMIPPRWNVTHSLPLQLSDLAGPVAAYALWSSRRWAVSLAYYWGLTLNTQALVTPVLRGPDFPDWEFVAFWVSHLFVGWVAVYLTWGLRMRPDWHSYRLAVAITVCWAVVAQVVNLLVDGNYGYLNRKPVTGSLLDVLGPWPWYLIPVAVLVLVVWALMTWPWTIARRQTVS